MDWMLSELWTYKLFDPKKNTHCAAFLGFLGVMLSGLSIRPGQGGNPFIFALKGCKQKYKWMIPASNTCWLLPWSWDFLYLQDQVPDLVRDCHGSRELSGWWWTQAATQGVTDWMECKSRLTCQWWQRVQWSVLIGIGFSTEQLERNNLDSSNKDYYLETGMICIGRYMLGMCVHTG
jgi:hypothetical protein